MDSFTESDFREDGRFPFNFLSLSFSAASVSQSLYPLLQSSIFFFFHLFLVSSVTICAVLFQRNLKHRQAQTQAQSHRQLHLLINC